MARPKNAASGFCVKMGVPLTQVSETAGPAARAGVHVIHKRPDDVDPVAAHSVHERRPAKRKKSDGGLKTQC